MPKSEIGESIKRNFKDTEAVLEGFAELVGRDECEKLIPFIKKGGIGQEYKAVKLKPIQDKDKRKVHISSINYFMMMDSILLLLI